MPVCDVCSQSLDFSEGYALTTRQIAADEAYWSYMLEHGGLTEDILPMYAQQQAMQRSGWLLCESCSRKFTFDESVAKDCARRQADPPGSGPIDWKEAAGAAARAWKLKHGRFPSWVK
jgi:hypothetical protein